MHEGNILQKAAKRSKLGVNGFAEAYGTKRTTLYYLFGKDSLDEDFKQEAARILGTTVDELFIKGNTKTDILDELNKVAAENVVENVEKGDRQFTATPLVPVYAYAGYLAGYGDNFYIDDLPLYYTEKLRDEDKYRAFEVRGDSMNDGTARSIVEGCYVLGKRVERDMLRYKLQMPREYIIVHKEHGILIKEITDHDIERGRIVCTSYNHKYPDLRLNLNDVVELYSVKEFKIKKP